MRSLLRVKEFTYELETADSVLCTLGLIVEGRDPYTEGHWRAPVGEGGGSGTASGTG